MKNLPIGIQTLPGIRAKNGIYVDKTRLLHQLATTGKYYFFSRPRRFGKSLLISTLKELYLGNKAVFEGLWIENNWDWSKTNPVLHFSFDDMDYKKLGLETVITDELLEIVFITGISKFAKISLFSHLNNLKDITLTEKYAALTGYTQEELEFYFEDYLQLSIWTQLIAF
jgi:hypothetical protein